LNIQTINANVNVAQAENEISNVTVGDNGNLDNFLASLSYEVPAMELELA
jgi:hypothetical protein